MKLFRGTASPELEEPDSPKPPAAGQRSPNKGPSQVRALNQRAEYPRLPMAGI